MIPGDGRKRGLRAWPLCLVLSVLPFELFAQSALPPAILLAVPELPTQESPLAALVLLRSRQMSPDARAPVAGPVRWVTITGRPLKGGAKVPTSGIRLHPVSAGTYQLPLSTGLHSIEVVEAWAEHEGEVVKLERSAPTIARRLPAVLGLDPEAVASFSDEWTLRLCGNAQALPSTITVTSLNASEAYVDGLRDLVLRPVPRREESQGPSLHCAQTEPLRLAPDWVDKNHPLLSDRTLVAQVGGSLFVEIAERVNTRVALAVPRLFEGESPQELAFKVRARVLRSYPGGPPALGSDDAEAKEIVLREVQAAAQLWGQCGFSAGPQTDVEVQVVDPPPSSLLTVGCGGGFAASGGEIRFQVGTRRVTKRTRRGQAPQSVASELVERLQQMGFGVDLFANPLIQSESGRSFDLQIRDSDGQLAQIRSLPSLPVSDDPSLSVCIGHLELADGLAHFVDDDAAGGTLEERSLVRGLGDSSPDTIDLFVVPTFSGVGRIGESFIDSPGASLENVLILDRGGLRASARSSTLAHELGHILLDLPGHPDDYGVDTPTSLMDADAADPTVYGPRRLSVEECRRAWIQSGPRAPVRLLKPSLDKVDPKKHP